MVKGSIVGFVAGAILTAAIFYLAVLPNLRSRIEKLSAEQQQSAGLQAQAKSFQDQVQSLQGQIQTLTTDRDACKSKFERATFLYDIGLLGGETRAWVIPVDVEPRAMGMKRGTFSHYDPKNQTETVHFKPAANQ